MSFSLKYNNSWLRAAFVVSQDAIDTDMRRARIFSGAYNKYTDTTMGGTYAVNPPPQACRWTDIRSERRFKSISKGMGTAYSKMHDDNSILLNVQAGVADFTSLTSFFSNFYSSETAYMVRTGRSPGFLFNISKLAGYVVTLPVHITVLAGTAIRWLTDKPITKFCSLKETQALYWNAVSTMFNRITGSMGLVQDMRPQDYVSSTSGLTREQIENNNRLLPDVVRSNGQIDIYSVAGRAQRKANQFNEALMNAYDKAGDFDDLMDRIAILNDTFEPVDYNPTLSAALDRYMASDTFTPKASSDQRTGDQAPSPQPQDSTRERYDDPSYWDYVQSEWNEGSKWVTFRVNYNGAIGESFSNSSTEPPLKSAVNSMSSKANVTRFSFADGKLDDGIIGKTIGMFVDGVKSVIGGLAAGVGIDGLGAILGNGLVDIQNVYESSRATLPKETYTMQLRSPLGDPYSRAKSLIYPLCCVLGIALPRATGAQSYQSPFYISAQCKGRSITRFGLVSSLTIQRGVGNLGFDRDGFPLAIDVTMEIEDLSSIAYMPITAGMTPFDLMSTDRIQELIFGDENSYGDYMDTLGALSLIDQMYMTRRLRRNYRNAMLDLSSWFSTSHLAQWSLGSGSMVGRWIQAVHVTDRP